VAPDRLHVIRDVQYIKWRYNDHPFNSYKYIAAKSGNVTTKIAISRFDDNAHEVVLCDFFFCRGCDAALGFLVEYLRKARLNYKIKMWQTTPDIVRRQFISNFCRNKSVGQRFLVRSFPGKNVPGEIFNINNWFLTHGDAEIM